MSLYDRLFKPRRYTLPNGTVVEEKRSRAPLVILIVLVLACAVCAYHRLQLCGAGEKGQQVF